MIVAYIYFIIIITLALISILSGMGYYFIKKDTTILRNALKILFLNFAFDNNKSAAYGLVSIVLRHSWEILQTCLGNIYSQTRNIFWKADRVESFCGIGYVIKYNKPYNSGISLSNFININTFNKPKDSFKEEVVSEPFFMHEYGHSIDSKLFGVFYLFAIGIPSLISAMRAHQIENQPLGVSSHYNFWSERRANRNAEYYFGKYFSVNWAASYKNHIIETYYKTTKLNKIENNKNSKV